MSDLKGPLSAHRRRAVPGLAVHAGVLAAGATATVGRDAATWFGVRGPQCPIGACFGPVACPGCGLVRSVSASVQGDFAGALAMHPAGPVIALLAVLGAALHLGVLWRGRPTRGHDRWLAAGRRVLLLSLLVGWLARAFLLSGSAP